MLLQNNMRGITLIEICVIVAIIIILVGMTAGLVGLIVNSANTHTTSTENSTDAWKRTDNLTPSTYQKTYILTDPTTGQKWVVVQCTNGVTMSPYSSNISIPKEIKVEGQ